MKKGRAASLLPIILALLVGIGLGLAYPWALIPLRGVEASPSILRADFKDQYRLVIAAAYAYNHDPDRARARLALLEDPDLMQAMSVQAQQILASGQSFNDAKLIAQLALDLQKGDASVAPTQTSFETALPSATVQLTGSVATPSISVEETILPTDAFSTPMVFATAPPRPTQTPIPLPLAPFVLVGQDTVCDLNLPQGLLQIMLMDARRRQLPGVKITVTWNGGEDSFFTGFKPEFGNGYADFQMTAGIVYSVQLVEGGAIVSNVSVPVCVDPNGQAYNGGILLTFQQP